MTQKANDTRSRLLEAALAILTEGKEALSFDAVAKRVGISKGGLIHHFPTRDSLVESVVHELVGQFTSITGPTDRPADLWEGVKDYVFGSLKPEFRSAAEKMARGLIRLYGSDFRKNAPFLEPWRRLFASRLDPFRQNGDMAGFARAAIVTLAVECFVLIDVFGLYQFTEREMEAIKRQLLAGLKIGMK